MHVAEELKSSWQRLWLQAGDPAFEEHPDHLRRELAQIWAMCDAAEQLGKAVEVISAELNLRLCEIATSSLRDPASFDEGYWPDAARRARAVDAGVVPGVEIPVLAPDDVNPVELMAEIMARSGFFRAGDVAPVVHMSLKAERSRPGWRITGLPASIHVPAGISHLAAFAIDEGDNEVLAIVSTDAIGTTVDLTEDDVVTGLHERARLEDQLTVSALVGALRSMQPPPDDTSRLRRAMAHAAVLSASAAMHETLTVRARAVSAAVTSVASVVALDGQPDPAWHLTRLVTLL